MDNPYRGLFPYTPDHEKFFFGREMETYDLIEMIKKNQLVVIYGESGTGKTSLINAKLFPELRRQYYFPIYIRLNYTSDIEPLEQVRRKIYSELQQWGSAIPEFTPDISLIEYAARTSVFKGLVKPILFFDQFEELFTLGPASVSSSSLNLFIDQLSDLIELRFPRPAIKKEITVSAINGDYHKEEDLSKKEKEIKTENALRFTVVISLRQDFIANLDDLQFCIPSITSNRYRIRKFRYAQAFEAIIKPAKVFLMDNYGETYLLKSPTVERPIRQDKELEVVTLINKQTNEEKELLMVDALTGKEIIKQLNKLQATEIELSQSRPTQDKTNKVVTNTNLSPEAVKGYIELDGIDPTILSLYCFQLYNEAKKDEDGFSIITESQVNNSPCDKLLENYYRSSVFHKKIRYGIESYLITPDGRRLLVPLQKFLDKAEIHESEVQDLIKRTALVRIYGETDKQIELAHDQIAKRALVNRKSREANAIKRRTIILSLGVIVLTGLGVLTSIYYVNQKQKTVDVQNLQQEKLAQKREISLLSDTLSKLQKNYVSILTKSNSILTDKAEINVRIKLLQDQLSASLTEADSLYVKSSELALKYIKMLASRDSLTNYSRQLNSELSDLRNKMTNIQGELTKKTTDLNNALIAKNALEAENTILKNQVRRLSTNDQDDPQKGKWGLLAERNGRKIDATIRATADPDLYEVIIIVSSTDSKKPLSGTVTLHLHPTFDDQNPVLKVVNGQTTYKLTKVHGTFTIGAETDGGKTKLELDLGNIPITPNKKE